MDETIRELLTQAADDDLSLAHRLDSATKAASALRSELERRCEVIFPDFYWSSSGRDSFYLDSAPDGYRVAFPKPRKWMGVDCKLTPERDAALRDLGFVYLNERRLGLADAPSPEGCNVGDAT